MGEPGARSRARWFREPLFHFVMLGGLAFTLDGALRPGAELADGPIESRSIQVSTVQRARARADFRTRTGRDPTHDEERALLDRWIDEEILFRHALEIGLDRNDVIVRRRLVQKMRFLIEDMAPTQRSDDDELAAWLATHDTRYRLPARLTFEQIFFSRDRRGDRMYADADAGRIALNSVEGPPPASLGDAFYLGRRFIDRNEDEIAASFGRPFAQELARQAGPEPSEQWIGPVPSAFGVHLVRVERHQPPRAPDLAEVHAKVARDLKQHHRDRANQAALRKLRDVYAVELL